MEVRLGDYIEQLKRIEAELGSSAKVKCREYKFGSAKTVDAEMPRVVSYGLPTSKVVLVGR